MFPQTLIECSAFGGTGGPGGPPASGHRLTNVDRLSIILLVLPDNMAIKVKGAKVIEGVDTNSGKANSRRQGMNGSSSEELR